MPADSLTRLYAMPDADLLQRAGSLHNTMTRDAADFATRNVNAPERTALLQARTAFSDFPTDTELLGEVNVEKDLKNTQREALEKAIRALRHLAAGAWGERSGPYKTFRFEGLANLRDNDLPRAARRVLRLCAVWQADLAAQGLTPAHTAALSAALAAYEAALDAVDIAEETREVQTVYRLRLGNALWALMQRYAGIGKSLFEDSDEARYNDYILAS